MLYCTRLACLADFTGLALMLIYHIYEEKNNYCPRPHGQR